MPGIGGARTHRRNMVIRKCCLSSLWPHTDLLAGISSASLDSRGCKSSSPCFFDGSGHLRCLASDASENSTSDAPEIGKSGFSDFRKSGFSEIRKSGNLKIRIFGFPEIRIFGNRISEIPENPEIRIFGYSDFRIFGKSGNPKIRQKGIGYRICLCGIPLKKHGD